jgi:hypothetical protein
MYRRRRSPWRRRRPRAIPGRQLLVTELKELTLMKRILSLARAGTVVTFTFLAMSTSSLRVRLRGLNQRACCNLNGEFAAHGGGACDFTPPTMLILTTMPTVAPTRMVAPVRGGSSSLTNPGACVGRRLPVAALGNEPVALAKAKPHPVLAVLPRRRVQANTSKFGTEMTNQYNGLGLRQ